MKTLAKVHYFLTEQVFRYLYVHLGTVPPAYQVCNTPLTGFNSEICRQKNAAVKVAERGLSQCPLTMLTRKAAFREFPFTIHNL